MKNLIQRLRETPIRKNSGFAYGDYMENKSYYLQNVVCNLPVDKSSKLHQEELARCSDYDLKNVNYYFKSPLLANTRAENYLNQDVWLRASILEDLQVIDESLKKHYLRLLILSGYRHPVLQALIIRQTRKNYNNDLADKMFANPDNYAPHTSGAALDLEIWDEKNNRVLPTKVFGIIDLFTLEEKDNLTQEEKEVRNNRRLIFNLLTSEVILPAAKVFVAHPFEYWHYGRNERMSAFFAANGHKIFYDVIRQI
ncbi:hypothetical protein ACFL2U_04050 [Patescibacteria group bacterium]